jgi:hypothetical protein
MALHEISNSSARHDIRRISEKPGTTWPFGIGDPVQYSPNRCAIGSILADRVNGFFSQGSPAAATAAVPAVDRRSGRLSSQSSKGGGDAARCCYSPSATSRLNPKAKGLNFGGFTLRLPLPGNWNPSRNERSNWHCLARWRRLFGLRKCHHIERGVRRVRVFRGIGIRLDTCPPAESITPRELIGPIAPVYLPSVGAGLCPRIETSSNLGAPLR